MTAPTRISVITVMYNSEALISVALASVQAAAAVARAELEVIVIDNASADASAEVIRVCHPNARLIINTRNVGFARATNQGIRESTGSHVLLLNPDARLAPDALATLIDQMRRFRAGAVAPSIGDGGAESAGMAPSLRSAAGHFLWINRIFSGDRGGPWRGVQLRRRAGQPRLVDWASAAVLLIDSRAVADVGGFDERFFLYGEDVDLGLRLTAAGHRVFLVPAARANHLIAASQGGVSIGWVDALEDLYARSASHPFVIVFDLIMSLGLTVRATVSSVRAEGVHAARMRAAARRAWWLLLTRCSPQRRDEG